MHTFCEREWDMTKALVAIGQCLKLSLPIHIDLHKMYVSRWMYTSHCILAFLLIGLDL